MRIVLPVSAAVALLLAACGSPTPGTDATMGTDAAADAATPPDVQAVRGGEFAHCAATAECQDGLNCDTRYAGGLCLRPCPSDFNCGTTATCVGNVCAPKCGRTGPSCDAMGGVCVQVTNTEFGCYPACFASGATNRPGAFPGCVGTTSCDVNSGLCLSQPLNPSGGGLGAPCTRGGDCKSNACYYATRGDGSPTGYIGGACISVGRYPSDPNDAVSNCPPDGAFVPIYGQDFAGGYGYCFKRCSSEMDCRAGYQCDKPGTSPIGTCYPIDCTAAGRTCPAGSTCRVVTEGGRQVGRCAPN